MFPFDADCAVEFKRSDGSTTITAHDAMRVVYAVSGGCTIDHNFKAASSSSGVVDDTIVFVGIYQACVLSFTAYFGASPDTTVSATSANLASETRTVVASSVVFGTGTALAAGPLVAGVSNTFTREFPILSRLRHCAIIGARPPVCCSARL